MKRVAKDRKCQKILNSNLHFNTTDTILLLPQYRYWNCGNSSSIYSIVFGNLAIAIFFLGSGIAQIFWILPMLKRWGKPWYYIGIGGNLGFIILYVITLLPGNPVTGRGGQD